MREAFGVCVLWNHARAVFGVTRQDAEVADHVEPRRWNCRAEPHQKVMGPRVCGCRLSRCF